MKKIFNKKYWKYRLKMQEKFEEVFGNKNINKEEIERWIEINLEIIF
ncbi:hypothetical protein PMY12_14760 [Clostridium tertium]|nr:hypothetical protein [Clostridium tertium]MDB1938265.1 hypothetical protein [Clostridium tertium]